MQPETRYVKSDDISIAYQVVGDTSLDLVFVPPWFSHVELAWEEPLLARFLERLASFSRLILFDKRGTGLSDRVPLDALPTLEERMDDVRAVADAAGSEQAALLGCGEGGNICTLYAASHPERVTSLVLYGTYARRMRSEDYAWGRTPEERRRELELLERDWGGRMDDLAHYVPSKSGDEEFMRRLAAYFRRSASPGAAAALLRMNTEVDVRAVLGAVRVPTLVLHRSGDREVGVEEGRYLAEQIPGARFVELAGEDHFPWVGDQGAVLDEIEEFLTGERRPTESDRVLVTLLFTDIVGSTARTAELGDRAWSDLIQRHDTIIRRELARWRGQEIDRTGDGFLAAFDGPARAIQCAKVIVEGVRLIGLEVRAGVHTGESERVNGGLRGIAVHIGARVTERAGPGEVLISQTVRDLITGSGIELADHGEHELKGVPGIWRLYGVVA